MMKKIIKFLIVLIVLLVVLLAAATVYMGRNTYQISNTVVDPGPYGIDPALNRFHRSMFIADMHVDTFNFETDFFKRNDVGQVDLPRIQEGGLSLMTMAIATEVPFSVMAQKPGGNARGGNLVTLGAITELEPMKNWFSQYERGLYFLNYARQLIAENPQHLMPVTHREDLEIFDRVGGGDSFASGLIYGFLTTNDAWEAVEYGAAHGALAMTTPGDTTMATLAEVEKVKGGGSARVDR